MEYSKEDIVLTALKVLGDNSNAIRATLKELGIKGTVGCSGTCPIANFLKKCGFKDVDVRRSEITLIIPPSKRGWYIITPAPIHTFIGTFDSYHYPELCEAIRV